MALFVKLDVTWVDHPKLLRAGVDGMGLHALAMCLAKRGESDGWVDLMLLHRYGATDDLIGRLADLELLEVDGERARPWDWLDRNPSKAAIAAKRATKAEAGKRGNHERWHSGVYETCGKCNGQVIAGSDRTASHPDSGPIAPLSPDLETDLETECDRTRDPLSLIRSYERGSDDAPRLARRAIGAVAEPTTTAGGMGAGQADTQAEAGAL